VNFKRVLPSVAVFLLAFVVYARTLGHDLVWDDLFLGAQIRERAREHGLPGVVSAEFRFKPHQATGYYRPVVLLSLWQDARLARFLPSVYHLENILWHAGNSVLVLLLLRLLLGSTGGALFGAALFALHPVHSESVAFVSGRTDLQATFFLLTSVLLWLRARTESGARRPLGLALSLAAFLVAALAKETVFALPAVVLAWLLLEAVPGPGRRTLRAASDRAWLLGLGAVIGCVLALRWRLGIPFGTGTALAESLTLPAIEQKAAMLAGYCRLLLLPWPLRAWYTADQIRLSPTAGISVAALIAAGFCARSGARRMGVLSLLWLAGFLFPVMGLVRFGSAIVAERYLYLPSVGFCLLCAVWFETLLDAERYRRAAAAAAVVLLLACGAAAAARADIWKDEHSLYRNLVQTTPAFAEGHVGLGIALRKQGDRAGAIAEFTTALALDPRSENAHNNLGNVLADLGQRPAAIEHYRQSAQLNPDNAEVPYNLGRLYAEENNIPASIAAYRESLRLNPNDPDALNNLAWQLIQVPGTPEFAPASALGYALRANEIAGGSDPVVLDTLAAAYAANQRYEAAAQVVAAAIPLADARGAADLSRELRARLAVYRARIPVAGAGDERRSP
jgi:Flp pilus assembly protein TadD